VYLRLKFIVAGIWQVDLAGVLKVKLVWKRSTKTLLKPSRYTCIEEQWRRNGVVKKGVV